jgi:asparagine synthase (glutamine-hydrolysing)
MIEFLGQKDDVLAGVLNQNILSLEASRELFKQKFAEYYHPHPNSLPLREREIEKDFEKYLGDFDRQNWLVDESLMRTDRMTMAHGVEARVPILDRRLVELANKTPTDWKIRGNAGKVIWKEAMDKYLPEHIKNERKRGFFSPMAKWLRQEFKSLAYDTVASLDPQYFNRGEIRRMLDDHISGKRYNMAILWAVMTWSVWSRVYKK